MLLVALTLGCANTSTEPNPQAPASPPSSFAPGIAFDSDRDRFVIVSGETDRNGLSPDTWEWSGTSWTRTATSGPSPRMWSAMAYDAHRRRIVLFGGASSTTAHADTWEYDGTQWRQVDVAGPPGRYAHEMVYDAERRKIVMFGGRDAASLSDTWEFDGTMWREIAAAGPSARFSHGMAYDPMAREVVVFGGHGPVAGGTQESLAGTWTLSANTWTQRTAAEPSRRDHVSLVYDVARQKLVLYGGIFRPTPGQYLETWERGTAWTQVASSGPEPRGNHRLVYDSRRNRVLLWTGAADGSTAIWALTAGSWVKVS